MKSEPATAMQSVGTKRRRQSGSEGYGVARVGGGGVAHAWPAWGQATGRSKRGGRRWGDSPPAAADREGAGHPPADGIRHREVRAAATGRPDWMWPQGEEKN